MSQRQYTYQFSVVDKLTAPVKKMAGAFGVANKKRKIFDSGLKKEGKSMVAFGKRILNVKNLLIGGFVTSGITRLGTELTGTLAEFEKFEAILTTTLGNGSAAKMVLNDITDFASKTPFQVNELTDSWVRMANQGFRPNMEQMTQLGDLSSSTGKGFNQLSEAILDAQTGQFERLKEFGINAAKSGDKVVFTFKGVKKEVDFTSSSIQEYLLGLGKMKGVQGSMAGIMETTGGKLSNLSDKVTMLKLKLGTALKPVISSVIDLLGRFTDKLVVVVGWVQQNREQFLAWVKVLSVAGAAFLGFWYRAKLISGLSIMLKGALVVWRVFVAAVNIAKVAFLAFNVIVSLNPIGLLVVVIGLAIGALIAFSDKLSGVRAFIGRVAKWMWKNNPFAWMINLIDVVFPGFKSSLNNVFAGIKQGFKDAFDFVYKKFIEPVKSLLEKLFGVKIGRPSVDNIASAMAGSRGRLGASSVSDVNPYGSTGAPSSPGGSFQKGSKGGLGINSGVSAVSGGGGNIKHITINLEALIKGGLNITTNTLSKGKEKIKAELERLLLDVVNDVNYQ